MTAGSRRGYEIHILPGNFITSSTETLDSEDEAHRIVGWWVAQGFEVERVCLRTTEDDNDLRLMVGRDDGRVVAVVSNVRAGAKEWGWV